MSDSNDNKVSVSWGEVTETCNRLVMKISQSKDWPKIIVAIANGGSVPAVIMSHAMGIREILYVRATHYAEDGTRSPNVGVQLENSMWELDPSAPVLIVDDIYDTGDTLHAVVNEIMALNKTTPWRVMPKIITATLFLRGNSTNLSSGPTHYGRIATEGTWLVFPWEKSP
jgi:hypothetical protein